MASMKEEFDAMKTRIPELEEALALAGEESTKLTGLLELATAELVEAKALHEQAIVAKDEQISTAAADLQTEKDAAVATASELEAATAKLQLSAYADAVPGEEDAPAEGGEGAVIDPVDHRAVMESLEGQEAQTYYREHRAEIDVQFEPVKA